MKLLAQAKFKTLSILIKIQSAIGRVRSLTIKSKKSGLFFIRLLLQKWRQKRYNSICKTMERQKIYSSMTMKCKALQVTKAISWLSAVSCEGISPKPVFLNLTIKIRTFKMILKQGGIWETGWMQDRISRSWLLKKCWFHDSCMSRLFMMYSQTFLWPIWRVCRPFKILRTIFTIRLSSFRIQKDSLFLKMSWRNLKN